MEYAKKMVLVPQETLTKLQSARRLEQTPTTRVVHSIDAEMGKLLERQDLNDDQKIKLYHQTLQRYMELNSQRMAPLTMTLKAETDNPATPSKLKPELPTKTTKIKVPLSEDPEEDGYGLPKLFAEASHLPTTPVRRSKRKKSRRPSLPKQKWTPY